MAKFYDRLNDELIRFIGKQAVFFVASAAPESRINLSPKGLDTFRVVDAHTVCYLDLTGSGNETAAHLLADSRLTIMFCSFSAKPLILRLYGQGRVIRPNDPGWVEAVARFPAMPGVRQVVCMDVQSVQTSCGFGVPQFPDAHERPTLHEWAVAKGPAGVAAYQQEKNRTSIDGLPTGLAGD